MMSATALSRGESAANHGCDLCANDRAGLVATGFFVRRARLSSDTKPTSVGCNRLRRFDCSLIGFLRGQSGVASP